MKALALVEARNHVCCRYRVRAFEHALADSGWSLAIEPLETGPIGRLAQISRVGRFDAVILQRKLLPGWQLGELRRHAKRLIFDFDDAVLHRDSYDCRGPRSHRRSDRFRRTVRAADVVIAGNAFLASCSLDAGAEVNKVRVIPTCIEAGSAVAGPGSGRTDGIDLVWIGSGSTLAGLDRQRPLWERLGREVPGLRLRMVCDRFLRFESLPVVAIPWSEATEAADVAAGDVGISWIPDDLWSRGKCGLKVLQYQAAGLPVVANPVGVHPEIIRPGANGLLASTADEWVEAVRRLAVAPDFRARLGRAARESVEADYSVEAWASAFVDAVIGGRSWSHAGPIPAPKSNVSRDPLSSSPGLSGRVGPSTSSEAATDGRTVPRLGAQARG